MSRSFSPRMLAVVSVLGATLPVAAAANPTKKEQGIALAAQKRFAEALEVFTDAFAETPEAAIALNISEIHRYFGEKERQALGAGGTLEAAVRAESHFIEAYNWMAASAQLPRTNTDVEKAERLRVALQPKVAVVEVATQPEGASIAVDGRGLGVRTSVAVSPGEHKVQVQLRGYVPREVAVLARLGQSVPLRLQLERVMVDVRVEAHPPGASVRASTDSAPLVAPGKFRLPMGRTTFRASAEGYTGESREVEVAPGMAPVVFRLREAPETIATLTVKGSPAGAGVFLTGRLVGQIPMSLPGLKPPPEPVEVTIQAVGYTPVTRRLSLKRGQITVVDVALSPVTPPPSPWWRWLGYGGAAAFVTGAGVGGVAVMQKEAFPDEPSRSKQDHIMRLNTTADVLMVAGLAALVTSTFVHLGAAEPPASRAEISVGALVNHVP